MKKYVLSAIALLATAAVCSTPAIAGTIVTNVDDAPPNISVPGVADWATASTDMNGMRITATFFGGGTQTVNWGNRTGGGASGTGWDLYMSSFSGNTLDTPWILDSSGSEIMSILIEGNPGNTIFDIQPLVDSLVNTDGSRDGVPFADSYVDAFGVTVTDSVVVSTDINIVALYSTLVVVNGSAPKKDLYSNLLLTFTNTNPNKHGFDTDSTLSFIADTDNGGAPVPEPATLLLLGSGIAGLLGSKIRQKK
ncbi:MAG: PEP-CTERM sorting domain-containing protein [Desulfoprunum sp.]|nr:PEP-CTERM sorting domain-containing protein [Desulfoprunum sp.]